jgi:16S rRNA (cytidine1402-2'-O)-methyltransferase
LPVAAATAADLDSALHTALATMKVKDAARSVAEALGVSRSDAYARALVIKHGE